MRTVALFCLIPLLIWGAAFFGWLYWKEFEGLFLDRSNGRTTKAVTRVDKPAKRAADRAREKLFEEDRRKLDEILRKR